MLAQLLEGPPGGLSVAESEAAGEEAKAKHGQCQQSWDDRSQWRASATGPWLLGYTKCDVAMDSAVETTQREVV
jgi:hypothetical protein